MEYEVILFSTTSGRSPVKSFILSLDERTQAKIKYLVWLLIEFGPRLNMPHAKCLSDSLYELRVRGKVEIRLLYTFVGGRIYLLHGFQKKSQKIPLNEIRLAEARRDMVIRST